jgi:hypothetical protein
MTNDLETSALPSGDIDKIAAKTALLALHKSKVVIYSVYAMVLSYFYNLPVMTYSATGNNELRLYDFAGLLILIIYLQNFALMNGIIRKYKMLSYLFDFLLWISFTMIFTTIGSILNNKLLWVVQTLLYLFHFYTFFLTAVFLIIMIQDLKQLKNIVHFSLICSILAFTIVLLQNFGVLPFLWNVSYENSYYGFLSGTFGPNKIVLGMSCLMMFALCMGLLNDKRVKINKVLLITTISLASVVAVLSGSRTTYLGLVIFLLYFMIRDIRSFAYSATGLLIILVITASINDTVLQMAAEVYQNRVENKIEDPDDLQEARVDEIYEDLGAGRKGLSLMYLDMLSDNPEVIPFGRGFNNRIENASSAHNIYLSLINEVGLVGCFLYFRWLTSYMFVRMSNFPQLRMALKGLALSMLITLLFGEHLYVYRALFGLVGLFLFVVTVLTSPIFVVQSQSEENL